MLSPSDSLLKRVALVIVTSLVLIKILFIAYSAIPLRFRNPPDALPEPISVKDIYATLPFPSTEIDASICEKAIAFALKSLQDHPETTPFVFKHEIRDKIGGFVQPADARISLLVNLSIYESAFLAALAKYPTRCWEEPEVLEAANACMQIDYVISCWTLEDLDKLNKDEQAKKPGVEITCEETLTKQRNYAYKAYFFCPSTYHQLKGKRVWQQDQPTSDEYGNLFHKKGTMQNSWNQLYNDYCRKVKSYMDKEKFTNTDERYLNWVKEDRPGQPFLTPGPKPT
jgi:hypothetical protein